MKTNATGRRCEHCNGELVPRAYKHTQMVGRWKTTDGCAFASHCGECGAPQLSLEELQTYQIAAVKTVLCEGHLEGEVIRYARKALGFTQRELGALLGYQHETISRMENGKEPMTRTASAALVGVLCRALEGERPEDMLKGADADLDPDRTLQVRRYVG